MPSRVAFEFCIKRFQLPVAVTHTSGHIRVKRIALCLQLHGNSGLWFPHAVYVRALECNTVSEHGANTGNLKKHEELHEFLWRFLAGFCNTAGSD